MSTATQDRGFYFFSLVDMHVQSHIYRLLFSHYTLHAHKYHTLGALHRAKTLYRVTLIE